MKFTLYFFPIFFVFIAFLKVFLEKANFSWAQYFLLLFCVGRVKIKIKIKTQINNKSLDREISKRKMLKTDVFVV